MPCHLRRLPLLRALLSVVLSDHTEPLTLFALFVLLRVMVRLCQSRERLAVDQSVQVATNKNLSSPSQSSDCASLLDTLSVDAQRQSQQIT